MRNSLVGSVLLLVTFSSGPLEPAQGDPRESGRFIAMKEILRAISATKVTVRRAAYQDLVREIDALHKALHRLADQDKKGEVEWEDKEIACLLIGKLCSPDSDTPAALGNNLEYRPVTVHDIGPDDPLRSYPAANVLRTFGLWGLEAGVFPRVEHADQLGNEELEIMAPVVKSACRENIELASLLIKGRVKQIRDERVKGRYDKILELLK
jgi:hypothetical protein